MEDELTLISEDHRAQLKGFLQSKGLQTMAHGPNIALCLCMALEVRVLSTDKHLQSMI